MMRSKLSWVLILIALSVAPSAVNAQVNGNQLQNPTPSPNKSSKPPQEQSATSAQQADTNQRQPDPSPVIVNVLPPQKTQDESDREAKAQRDKASSDWWQTIFNGLLVAFTAILVAIGAWQGQQNRKSADAARDAAIAAIEQSTAIKLSERAYVAISHVPPGLGMDDIGGVWVEMRVKNFGRTPGRTERINIDFLYLEDAQFVPDTPPRIERQETVSVFLVTQDEFFFNHQRALGATVVDNLREGKGTLLVWGYVDYLDAFNRPHRAGYGRIYNASLDDPRHYRTGTYEKRSNLNIVIRQAYNYDRERRQDEI